MLEASLCRPDFIKRIQRATAGALVSDEKLQDICRIIRSRMSHLQAGKGEPEITVCIPAHNEEKRLAGCLSAISRNQRPDQQVEIVLINNKSSDRTAQIGKECGVRVVDEEKLGLPYARQSGIEAAKGKIVCWTDADSMPVSSWITEMSSHFKDPSTAGVFGRIVYYDLNKPFIVYRYLMDNIKRIIVPSEMASNKCVKERPSGANFAYLRQAALDTGGYKPHIELGEDYWMGMQLKTVGNVVSCEDDKAVVYTSARRENKSCTVHREVIRMLKNRFGMKNSALSSYSESMDDGALKHAILEANKKGKFYLLEEQL